MLVDLGLDPYRVDKAIAGFGMPMGPFRQGLGAALGRVLAVLKHSAAECWPGSNALPGRCSSSSCWAAVHSVGLHSMPRVGLPVQRLVA